MGQGALSKPVVQWWLSLNSSMGNVVILEVIKHFFVCMQILGGFDETFFVCMQIFQCHGHGPSSGQELRPSVSQSVGLGGWHGRADRASW